MEGNKNENKQTPVVRNPPPYAYYPPEDEIDLADLWRVLVRRKGIIFSLATMVTIGVLLYALLATPVYRVEAVFLPPSGSDIQALNIAGLHSFSPSASVTASSQISTNFNFVSIDTVYALFQQNLRANVPRQAVFEEMNLIDQLSPDGNQESNVQYIFNGFSQSIAVKKGKKSGRTITLTVEGSDPLLIATIINQLSKEVEQLTAAAFISDVRAKVNASIKDVIRKMALLQELQEKLELSSGNRKTEQINAQNNDGPFTTQIREKEYELAWLKSIQIDPATVKTARLDQAAYPPTQQIKPKRKLIVVLGLILGLMLGVFAAFFVNFLDNQKAEQPG